MSRRPKVEPTLGPWEIVEFTSPMGDWTGARFVIRSAKAPGGIALIMGGLGGPEEKANAALIAAAPAMLKAIEGAMHALRSYQYGNDATELAEEAADFLDKVIREVRAT
jgi:hypothetical protein